MGMQNPDLPQDFNPELYLELNQDVKASGMDPVIHWTVFGHREGRKYSRHTLSDLGKSAKIAIFAMVKNEGRMLEAWIKHHSSLVGIKNLYLFDNGSTDSLTIKILSEAENLGCNVERRFTEKKHFEAKGSIMLIKFQELDLFEDYDFYLPLDCDELLAVELNGSVFCSKDLILNSFQSIPITKEPLKMTKGWIHNPLKLGFFRQNPINKTFFYRESAIALDTGYHAGKSKNPGNPLGTSFGLLDYHFLTFEQTKIRAKEKLLGRLDISDYRQLIEYQASKKKGYHLVRELLMEEEEFLNIHRHGNYVELLSVNSSLRDSETLEIISNLLSQ
jgi:hypothetical protein